MNPYQDGMPDGEQDAGINPTLLLRQATVRGSSFEAPMEVMFQDIEYAGRSYPESLVSSNHYDPSKPPESTTTDTSWDIDPLDSGSLPWDQINPSHLPASLDSDLRGMTGGHEMDPAILDGFLESGIDTGMSSTSTFPGRSNEGALMGLAGCENQPMASHQSSLVRELVQYLQHVNDGYRRILSGMECSQDQLRQAAQSLAYLTDHVNTLLQNQETPLPVQEPHHPPSPTESATITRYKCLECTKLDTHDKGTFTRHVNDLHYPKCKYLCPENGCSVKRPRRDQTRGHALQKHKWEPTYEELEAKKRENACPAQCPICRENLSSWKDFEKCYLKHCSYKVSSDAKVASRRGSDDHGNGGRVDEPSNKQPVEDICMEDLASAQVQSGLSSTTEPGRYPHSRSGLDGLAIHPARPLGPSHPSADGQITGDNGLTPFPANVPRRHLMPADYINRVDRHHRHGGTNRGTQGTRLETPRRESDPRCKRCLHRFSSCQRSRCCNKTESTETCHACSYRLSAFASILKDGLQMTGLPLGQQMYSNQTTVPSLLAPWYESQPANSQNIQEQSPYGNLQYGGPQFQGWTFDPSMGWNFTGTQRNSPRTNRRVLAVMSLEESGLSEQEMEIPPVPDLNAIKINSGLLKTLPMMNPLKRWFSKPLGNSLSVSLSGLDLVTQIDKPSSTIPQVNPGCQCKCACRARARAELASGRQVEMNFKLRLEYRGSSHLRSRVEIVVKLLKLRSSAAASKAKRDEDKSAIAKAFERTLVDRISELPDVDSHVSDESDAESVFDEDEGDALSISSSCPDLTSLITAQPDSSACPDIPSGDSLQPIDDNEDKGNSDGNIEIEFDFDLQSALSKLSKLTGRSSTDITCDMCISDTNHVFEYLTAYILYVIMSLARSRDYGNPRSDN